MAFTEDEKLQIRVFLGFPDAHLQHNTRLESQIERISNERPAAETMVRTLLGYIAGADAKVNQVLKQAGLKRVDEVEWHPTASGSSAAERDARSNGRMWCARLSLIIGVPLVGDAFGERGYTGDSWAANDFQAGFGPGGGGGGAGNGGLIPMG